MQRPSLVYQIIFENNNQLSVKQLCFYLKVSSSGYYKWLNSEESNRDIENKEIMNKIKKIFEKSNKTYGLIRIYKSIKNEGYNYSRNRIYRIKSQLGIKVAIKKKYIPKTTNSAHNNPISKRVFKIENYKVTKPNEIWVSDLTYIPMLTGFAFLLVILDVFTRKIVSWAVEDNMKASLLIKAFNKAIKGLDIKGMIFHSDQGIQFACKNFVNKLNLLEVIQSMSRKGNCYDNAIAESFFARFKNECLNKKYEDIEELRFDIFKYIDGWYNSHRLHSSLGYISPMDFEKKFYEKII